MSDDGYQIVIFGDIKHPEVKALKSYAKDDCLVVLNTNEIEKSSLRLRVALVSQTTKKVDEYLKVVDYLVRNCKETRVFNTICNATFENQEAVDKLSKEVDVMLIIGGKNSSNTRQLYNISLSNCKDSYLIECANDIQTEWFLDKKICGISAGASTPDWIIQKIVDFLEKI